MPRIHRQRIPITPASIDVHGHVNNLEYLRWMQDIATAHTALQGWSMARYLENGASWVVHSHQIEYLRPAYAGDVLVLLTWVDSMASRSSPRHYLFWHEASQKVIARATTLWYYVDVASGRPVAIPDELRNAFELVPEDDPTLHAIRRGGAKGAEALQTLA